MNSRVKLENLALKKGSIIRMKKPVKLLLSYYF